MALTLLLTAEQEATIAALAEAQGISRQEAVLRAVDEAAGRLHDQRLGELSAAARERYRDLLDRLGR